MVHTRQGLTGSEKLSYLQKALKGGSAYSVISSFEPTDANYAEAWDHLNSRYNVKREIIFSHLKTFEDFKTKAQDSDCGLRALADSIAKCVRCLKVQGVKVDEWDLILIYLALKKLDPESKKQWALDLKTDLPTMKEFLEFLETRARALTTSSSSSKGSQSSSGKKLPSSSAHHASSNVRVCVKCDQAHLLHHCPVFVSNTLAERKDLVTKKKLCLNCLFAGHSVANCKMKFCCNACGERHHSLLHSFTEKPSPSASVNCASTTLNPVPDRAPESEIYANAFYSSDLNPNRVKLVGTLLATAIDSKGDHQICRVFCDPGSDSNFITERCVNLLGLKKMKTCVNVNGIGSSTSKPATGIVSFNIHSRVGDFTLNVRALVMNKITTLLPTSPCQSSYGPLKNLELADPQFNIPRPVDLLLGIEECGTILLHGLIKGEPGQPIAQNTEFGWMISGAAAATANSHFIQVSSYHIKCTGKDECLESSFQKLWELEEPEVPEVSLTEEDLECENHFVSTHRRNSDGGYTVGLPLKKSAPILGRSREAAVKRFRSVEARLRQQPELRGNFIRSTRSFLQQLTFNALYGVKTLNCPFSTTEWFE
jgi:hypothetical protein